MFKNVLGGGLYCGMWVFIESVENLKEFMMEEIPDLFKKSSYAKGWFEKFSSTFQKILNRDFCNLLSE